MRKRTPIIEKDGGEVELADNKDPKEQAMADMGDPEPDDSNIKRQRIVWVKKNLIDQTAALSYCLGVSIVHLSMFLVLFMVEKPDLEKASAFKDTAPGCYVEA